MPPWKRTDIGISSTEGTEDSFFFRLRFFFRWASSFMSPWKWNTTQTEAEGKVWFLCLLFRRCYVCIKPGLRWHNWPKSFSACASFLPSPHRSSLSLCQPVFTVTQESYASACLPFLNLPCEIQAIYFIWVATQTWSISVSKLVIWAFQVIWLV